jgi:DNA polymerase II small subunit/DNA polymerase delta subunit B
MNYPKLGVKPTDLINLTWNDFDQEFKSQINKLREIINARFKIKKFNPNMAAPNEQGTSVYSVAAKSDCDLLSQMAM